jgi:hypothetical protein
MHYLAATNAQAGPIGLAIVVVLGIAVVFLARSMMRHLGKVPASFDKKPQEPDVKTESHDDSGAR